jgi:hypothetical protein
MIDPRGCDLYLFILPGMSQIWRIFYIRRKTNKFRKISTIDLIHATFYPLPIGGPSQVVPKL